MAPIISVIIPIYNAEAYLEECIKSIQQQTIKNIEIICLNDASPDNSIGILEKLAEVDNRIVIISRENRGASACRNEGIARAQGKYVAFMDADDLYPYDDILEQLVSNAEEHNMSICGGGLAIFLDGSSDLKRNPRPEYDGYYFQKKGVVRYSDYQFDCGFTRFIYERKLLLDYSITFPEYTRFEDPPFFVKAMIQAGSFYALDRITYAYRIRRKQVVLNRQKVADTFKGLYDNWSLAKKYHFSKLMEYCYFRVIDHYKVSKEYVQDEERKIIVQIEKNYFRKKYNLRYCVIAKKKSRIFRKLRYVTILGYTFPYWYKN